MRLIKKISFKRVLNLPQHKKMVTLFEKYKEDTNVDINNSLKKTKELSKLNFYCVIDIINVITNKEYGLNYDKIFEDKERKIINFKNLVEEQKRLFNIVKDKNSSNERLFSKLGDVNFVDGCYLVATNKKSLNFISSLNLKKRVDILLIKLDFKSLPKEFEELCNEFKLKADQELKEDIKEYLLKKTETPIPPTIYDGFSEQDINSVNNLMILESLLQNAIEKEQYEFCAKIRDRIQELSTKK